MKYVVISGPLDDLRFADFRFIEESAKLGTLHVLLWSDALCEAIAGKPPKFPLAERDYVARAIRWISSISIVNNTTDAALPAIERGVDVWSMREADVSAQNRAWCAEKHVECRVIPESLIAVAPKGPRAPENPQSEKKKVVVTGCYDWLHSGHVRFFEECAVLGDLYVVVGNDANVRLLKGQHHPMFPELQRRYICSAIRDVKQALIASGSGWMDAEPEFVRIKPDIYVVNEDGDRPEKREFCEKHAVEYRVLKRLPKDGLPRRQSTGLRGF